MIPPVFDTTCIVCDSVQHIARISPGSFIHEGRYWNVDHAYPTSYAGWLVLILKRHAVALHELSSEEYAEFGQLLHRASHLLHHHFAAEKEYAIALGEGAGFAHLHIHIVPRAHDLAVEYRGSAIFKLLNPADRPPLSAEAVVALTTTLQQQF